jgi:DNA-binding beta-propeller fold protein YncE
VAARPTPRELKVRRLIALLALVLLVSAVAIAVHALKSAKSSRVATSPADSGATRTTTTARTGTLHVDVYSHTSKLRADVATDLHAVYVPSGRANMVTVIDPATKRILSQFSTGPGSTPQHIVPSFDLKTLWVLDNKNDNVIPIDAHTGAIGKPIPVNDPYNLYFSFDGRSAIVVAERHNRLDFRDPKTMALRQSVQVPRCSGINHADYSVDGKYLLVTCEYSGRIAKIDMATRTVVGYFDLPTPAGRRPVMQVMPDRSTASSMPQDIRLGPDGTKFYVADMLLGGVHVIDGDHLRELGFIATGIGAHSVTPSHDGRLLYVANRGSPLTSAPRHGPGSVSVIDAATDRVIARWAIPGGGSPDMGGLTADGRELWLSGRFDRAVYVFNTTTGRLDARIAVPRGPHGLCVWPQPGRFSLGHTDDMR